MRHRHYSGFVQASYLQSSQDSFFDFFPDQYTQAREKKMVLFHVLSAKQPFLRPEIPISCMLISFYEQQGWGHNTFRMYEVTCSCYRLLSTAFDTVLRDCL